MEIFFRFLRFGNQIRRLPNLTQYELSISPLWNQNEIELPQIICFTSYFTLFSCFQTCHLIHYLALKFNHNFSNLFLWRSRTNLVESHTLLIWKCIDFCEHILTVVRDISRSMVIGKAVLLCMAIFIIGFSILMPSWDTCRIFDATDSLRIAVAHLLVIGFCILLFSFIVEMAGLLAPTDGMKTCLYVNDFLRLTGAILAFTGCLIYHHAAHKQWSLGCAIIGAGTALAAMVAKK